MGPKGSGMKGQKAQRLQGRKGTGQLEHREASTATEGVWAQLMRGLGGWIQRVV